MFDSIPPGMAARMADLEKIDTADRIDGTERMKRLRQVYLDCYELVVPRMVRGGLIVADNAVNHAETLAPFLDRAHADPRVDAMILPFDNGELIARKR